MHRVDGAVAEIDHPLGSGLLLVLEEVHVLLLAVQREEETLPLLVVVTALSDACVCARKRENQHKSKCYFCSI